MGQLELIKSFALTQKSANKITQKQSNPVSTTGMNLQHDTFTRTCECNFHFDDSKIVMFGTLPEDYVNIEKIFVEAEPEHFSRLLKKKIPARPAHWDTIQILKPSYYISHIFSHEKGQGKDAVKKIVEMSLLDSRTNGRVTLQSDIIDGKTSPSGFYYKLGFRFADEGKNDIMQKWLEQGGKKECSPMVTGFIFLPKENIQNCLNY